MSAGRIQPSATHVAGGTRRAGGIEVETVTALDRFEAVRDAWDEVVSADPTASVHTTHEWLRRWWIARGEAARPYFRIARDREGPLAVAPCTRGTRRIGGVPLPIGELAGSDLFSRAQIALARRQDEALAAVLPRPPAPGGGCLDLRRVAPDGSLGRTLAARGDRFVAVRRSGHELPRADMRHGWDAYLAGRGKGFVRRLRKRRASREFVVQHHPGGDGRFGDDIGELTAAIGDVSRRSWSHREGTGLASTSGTWAFWRAVILDAGRKGTLRAIVLLEGQEPVAFIFGVVHRRTLYALKMAYDERVGPSGAGQTALGQLVRMAAEDGAIDWFDMDCVTTHGDYKYAWASEIHTLDSLYVLRRGPLSLLAIAAYRRHRERERGRPQEGEPRQDHRRQDHRWQDHRSAGHGRAAPEAAR